VGTKGSGLFCLNNGEFKSVEVHSDALRNDVRALMEDTEGDLWIGTSGGGLVRLKPRRFWFLSGAEGLPSTPLNTLCMDSEHRIWAGSMGAGIYAGQPLQFQRVRPEGSFHFLNYIGSVCGDGKEGVWVGSWGAGLFHWSEKGCEHYTTAQGLSDDVITAVAADAKEGAWAGTRSGTVHWVRGGKVSTHNVEEGTTANAVRTVLVRHNGTVWVGLEQGGLFRLTDGRFVPGITGEHSKATVSVLFEDSADRLWIGTLGEGLGCLVSSRLYWCDSHEGLPDDSVYQIIDDEKGDFWLGTARGISQVSKTGIEKFARGTSHFFPAMLCETEPGLVGIKVATGWPGAIRASDGRLWFATSRGIAVLAPSHFTPASLPPPVVIESVLVDGRLAAGLLSPEPGKTNESQPAPLLLPPGMHSLDFQFTALSYASPQNVLFRHRLDGYDLDWVEGGFTRKVHYGKLPPGDYTFHVTARGNDGNWTEEHVSMAFVVLPPVWRTWWFITLSSLAGVTAFVGALRLVMLRRLRRRLERAEQQRSMERERTRIARDMHDEIGSKLTRISFLSELAKARVADSQPIQAIAETSRDLLATLDELVWAVNPRNDNLEHLAAYLGHYAGEYFQMTSVECRLEIPAEIRACELTSEVRHHLFLAFKETLNNVLKHAQATRVEITMKEASAVFEIMIADNGRGFDIAAAEASRTGSGARRGGNGLLNLRQRLADVDGECQIDSSPGQGTRVRLILRLPKNTA
jgi:signal transduction histidine kinase/ligand-binding sensor domain-containing protein